MILKKCPPYDHLKCKVILKNSLITLSINTSCLVSRLEIQLFHHHSPFHQSRYKRSRDIEHQNSICRLHQHNTPGGVTQRFISSLDLALSTSPFDTAEPGFQIHHSPFISIYLSDCTFIVFKVLPQNALENILEAVQRLHNFTLVRYSYTSSTS